jgi:hypothetical protein
MVEENLDLEHLIDADYVPSSLERKKAILMYFLIWIFLSLQSTHVSQYEFYHLKQSLGWWTIFFLSMIVAIVLIFVPYLRIIPFFVFLLFLILRVIFFYQARSWQYSIKWAIILPIFCSFWWRMLSIFELQIRNPKSEESLPDTLES